jgi:hypothetical protein
MLADLHETRMLADLHGTRMLAACVALTRSA